MRAVIQRVKKAKVKSDNQVVGSINNGAFILLGVCESDTSEDSIWLSNKINNLRIFDDDEGKMNNSISDINGDFLVVSQFTLHAKTKKGNRPSFIKAAKPEKAKNMYLDFMNKLNSLSGKKCQSGSFGNYMEIETIADGPVTIIIDTDNKE